MLAAAGLSPNNGLGAHPRRASTRCEQGAEIKAAIEQGLADGPELAMVDSDRGITNLHVPSDVIVDASMPAMIRTSGHMWGPDGAGARHPRGHPRLARYAGIYQVVIDDCRAHGAYDPTTMGSVPNVGLMAQAAEEYGSPRQDLRDPARRHRPGRRRGRRRSCWRRRSAPGDIWRMCQTKDVADPGLGQARRHPRPGHRHAGGVLARRGPRPRRQPDRQGRAVPAPSTTPTGLDI